MRALWGAGRREAAAAAAGWERVEVEFRVGGMAHVMLKTADFRNIARGKGKEGSRWNERFPGGGDNYFYYSSGSTNTSGRSLGYLFSYYRSSEREGCSIEDNTSSAVASGAIYTTLQ